MILLFWTIWCILLKLLPLAGAIGQDSCISFVPSTDTFPVVRKGVAAPVLISEDDWPGVQRAAADFISDIQKVTGVTPSLTNFTATSALQSSTPPVIIGTLGKSSLVSEVIKRTDLDVSLIEGKWESFIAKKVSDPLEGILEAYIIIGSDKRGTIYGMYDHSEQFGVSPWYWWADVPTTKNPEIFVAATGCSHGPPSVQYRGIFLNDEQPGLQSWAMEKFTNGTGSKDLNSPFNHMFYAKLFELILRIKANFLWPAMWGSAFGFDDPLNQPLADWYGVVMGTSHQEPMMRSTPNEWNIVGGGGAWDYSTNAQNVYKYLMDGTERAKPYESVFTLGMRGDGDEPMSEETNIKLLEQIVADQRTILSTVFNETDLSKIPQVWALYKEVQGYYEDGMRVPDDVTLLWSDDNWGNVRRFPLASERNRTGGAGVYYHYDYVGDPRNYKWITSSQISKTFEQLSIAVEREATRLWIVNVGDLKPYELGIEFFITYGWDTTRWSATNLDTFVSSWAQREFNVNSQDANTIASIIGNVTRWNARRKPELLNGTTYSLTNYREAENVLAGWKALSDASTSLYDRLPPETKPAFFEMVHHPVLASATLGSMYIYQGMNNLRASQGRLSANDLADQVERLFEQDWELENQYHTMLDGKWNHMMDQTHMMYTYWQQPNFNVMPPIMRLQSRKQALTGPMMISPEGGQQTLTLDRFAPIQSRFIDVGAGGPNPFAFTVTSGASWLKFTPSSGTVSPRNKEQRVEVSIDWGKVTGTQTATILISGNAEGQQVQRAQVRFTAANNVPRSGFKGFVEGDGVVSIEAAHASRNTSVSGVTWRELPGYGRTISGVTPLPRMGNNGDAFVVGSGPSLEYDFYNFKARSGRITVTTMVSPSLNANGPDRPLSFAVQVDNQAAQVKQFIPAAQPGQLPAAWNGVDGFVANSIVSVPATFTASPGAHTLKVWMIEPAVVVQKIVIDTGGLRASYLGPPESVIV